MVQCSLPTFLHQAFCLRALRFSLSMLARYHRSQVFGGGIRGRVENRERRNPRGGTHQSDSCAIRVVCREMGVG
jgi:hypothetical protein